MAQNNTYNGWTNYATWRVNLELFDGNEWEGMSAEAFQELAEEHIENTTEEGFARGCAYAFISDVNWHEIAEAYAEEDEADEE